MGATMAVSNVSLATLLALGGAAMAAVRLLLGWLARLDAESRLAPGEVVLPTEASRALSIVVPAYNEEERLPSTLQETLSYLQRRRDRQGPQFTYEVIVVDDGSSDRTVAVASEFARKHGPNVVRVLQLPRVRRVSEGYQWAGWNRGKGHAVKYGMLCARGQNLLLMDADGATRVSDLERLEQKLGELTGGGTGATQEDGGLGFVLGSRAHMQDAATAQRTWVRNLLMHSFHFLVMLVVGNQIRDTQCGFKLFSRAAARRIFPNQRLQRFAFDVELVQLAQRMQVPMCEVQVHWTEIPGSKVRPLSMVHMAAELAAVKIGYATGLWAVRTPQVVDKQL